ncbi:MAG: LacI family transcriptional regulator [Glaciihabitans sp.]|nr:LacI family transcriptional regulator [Glaciihabitans sp.]
MTTMYDVAAHAQVSTKTVSRVFNNDPHVLPLTRDRVLASMKELQYIPNTLSQNFRTGRARVIGVAVPDIADPFFAAIARAVERVAATHGQAVAVTSLGEDADRERTIIESLLTWQLSGLIVAPISHDQSYLRRWADGTPLVFVDRAPTKLAADSFVEDDHGGAKMATTHLLGHGHRRVAFIGDSLAIPTTQNRLAGYKLALADAGIDFDPSLVTFGASDRAGATNAVRALADNADPATAVFSSNARCSMVLIPALQQLRRTDLALVGFGDFPMADALTPATTVVDQDPANLGEEAVQRILDRIASPSRKFRRRTILPVSLLERDSCFAPVPSGR